MFHFLQGYSKPIKRVKVISNNSFPMKISRIHLLCQTEKNCDLPK